MDADNTALACQWVSDSYVRAGAAALSARRKLIKALLSSRRLPATGWDEATIELLLKDAALMDSNNFPGQVGLGEREGRVACPLIARLHGRLAHGIGRSGDIAAEQPKAAGSSLLAKLAAALAGDALKLAGLLDLGPPLLLPCATGMSLTLTLLAAAGAPVALRSGQEQQQQQQQSAGSQDTSEVWHLPKYVIWSRIDQKTCMKSITAANLVPVVIELLQQGDQLVTDVAGIQQAVERLGNHQVAAVVTTTSCFAPRAPDDVIAVAKLCATNGVPHIINNAYGVQCQAINAAITAACRKGRVDAIVQSTDKNFMVPVGGAIVAAGRGRGWLVDAVQKNYPGRASITAHLDVLITLLHWGAAGWTEQLKQRECLFKHLTHEMGKAAQQLGERVLVTPGNPISLAMTLDGLASAAAVANAATVDQEQAADAATATAAGSMARQNGTAGVAKPADVTFFGAMLWARNVSGTRVLVGGKQQVVAAIEFQDYGCHISGYPHPYMTAAAAIGGMQQEVDVFTERLVKSYNELKAKWSRKPSRRRGLSVADNTVVNDLAID